MWIGCAAVLALIFNGYRSWLLESETFLIRRIDTTGNDILGDEELHRIAGFDRLKRVWDVDLNAAEKNLRQHPFIADVKIDRSLPDVIRMVMQEKQAVALLNFEENLYCVDWDGLVLPSKPGKLYDLPVLSGHFKGGIHVGSRADSDWVREGLSFLKIVVQDRPSLYGQISEVVIDKPEGLVVYTKISGIPVRIGEGDLARKIRYLEAILTELSREGDFLQIRYIDLRFNRQVIVGMRT